MSKPLLYLFIFLSFTLQSSGQEVMHSREGPEINGIKQFIEIDTENTTKPILLFLHGGPGFSSRTYLKLIKKKLEKDFILVQWDQRETGNTLTLNASNQPLTPELFHKDTEEVIDYLLNKFSREKLYILGFSWGGFMGLTFADRHPEKLYAYISVSAVFSATDSEKLTLEKLKSEAEKSDNQEAKEELAQIQLPFRSWEHLYFQRKWAAYFSGVKVNARTYPRSLFENWSKTWFTLYSNANKVSFFETTPKLDCPIYFFVTKKDLVANHTEAERYYDVVEAPAKEIIWFEKSTHEIPNQEPKKFAEELLKIPEKSGL